MWFTVVCRCALINNDMHHHSGQNVVDSQGAPEWVHNKFWPLWWHISLSIRVQTMLNYISICFLPQYQCQRKCFFKAQAEKGILQHIDQSSVVWTLIDNSILANQITRLAAIVVQNLFNHYTQLSHSWTFPTFQSLHCFSGRMAQNIKDNKNLKNSWSYPNWCQFMYWWEKSQFPKSSIEVSIWQFCF